MTDDLSSIPRKRLEEIALAAADALSTVSEVLAQESMMHRTVQAQREAIAVLNDALAKAALQSDEDCYRTALEQIDVILREEEPNLSRVREVLDGVLLEGSEL
jgi:hypothetical protein